MSKQHSAAERQRALVARIRKMYDIDPPILNAIASTVRHHFVPKELQREAYEDTALPIGEGQTISQPSLVAYMTNCLELTGKERVLEVGTGFGYQAAILSKLAKEVVSIERLSSLAAEARVRLKNEGISNVEVRVGDGSLGAPDRAPFDRMIITAAAKEIPGVLLEQLGDPGILIAPIGDEYIQTLTRVRKGQGGLRHEALLPVQFVPLITEKR